MAMLFVVMLNSASAQWGYGYYNPNVMMDPCVQSSIRAAQSSNWVMQQNQVIMQQQQMMMNNGWYSTPSYPNTYSNEAGTVRPSRKKKTCGACDGNGWIPETKGVASYGLNKWCEDCDKKVPSNHYHATCPSCKGEGEW